MNVTRRQGPWSEAVITLLGLGSVYFFIELPLPGIDRQTLEQLSPGAGDSVIVGALGMAPFITAFLLVEIAVAFWALVRKRPEPGPRARRWILACAFGLALVMSLVNASGIARFYEYFGVLASWPTVVLTLSAVTMGMGLVFVAISRWGMGNGFSLAILVSVILQARSRIAELLGSANDLAGDAPGFPLLLICGLGLVVACVALLRAREGRGRTVSVPVLAAGAVPLVAAGWVVPFLSMTGVTAGWAVMAAHASVVLALSVLLSWLFRLPSRVGIAVDGLETQELTRRLLIVGAGSGLVLFTLHLGAGVAGRTPGFFLGIAVVDILVAVAVCLDLADRARFRWRFGLKPVVEVAVLHTVFEADAAASRLASAGIDHYIQGYRHRSVQYVLAAYVEMRVLVAEADLVRARVALRSERGAGR